ncbi:MAG: hypothetical protein IPO92_21420 [Saprospiraceae bacterium]|nr:hypothetical protein [Saprospiraceae bacterium]
MKSTMYTLIFIFTLTSCRSVEKMVEKGNYEEAFSYAITKLQGKKNKKTSYVKALEKAFTKMNASTLHDIDRLQPESKPENWSKVLAHYKILENRLYRLDPLLPLVSEDGYIGSFGLKDYSNEIRIAEENTCLYHYNLANTLLFRSEKSKDKIFARHAYAELLSVDAYKINYKDTERLKLKAWELGKVTVYFDVNNGLKNFHGQEIEKEMWKLQVSKLNDFWINYIIGGFDVGKNIDYTINIELDDVAFSPERESVYNYSESKELLIRKEKVKEIRDSIEVVFEKEVFEKVTANISEIFREKKSELHGKIKVFDNNRKEYLNIIPINVYQDFKGYACNYVGDERALTPETKSKTDPFCEAFPSDFNMADNLIRAFKDAVLNESSKIDFL